MKIASHHPKSPGVRHAVHWSVAALLGAAALPAFADVTYFGVAAGDSTSTGATVWTRAADSTLPSVALALQISQDATFASGVSTLNSACVTDPLRDATCKLDVGGLFANTTYYYRFVGPANELSLAGRFKTAPDAATKAAVRFAFSGDYDGLIRPYALASQIPAQKLDFYVNLGDVIYENASNLGASGTHNAASWLNSPSVTLSGSASTLNDVPAAGTTFATRAQLKGDYEKKYRENLLPVNTGGQNGLQALYAAQGIYTTWDNHELGNRQYINGGAPAGGSVGGPTGTDMPTGRGVDARANGSGNPGNVNDANASTSDYMNGSAGFKVLRDVLIEYMPISDNRELISASTDPRTDGSKRLYSAHRWGRNAIYINTDSRSYRDLRLKTANGSADDTAAPRANNPGRSYLGTTQLQWLKETLLQAHNSGAPWKFVSLSDPIDQIGPIAGALTLQNLPSFGTGSTYTPVSADGGKSFIGGYRAERNDLLKFIADKGITNVVFVATDDHQNRINEVTYSPTGNTELQSTYVKVPFAFSMVAGPLGATGPDLITNHTFSMAQQLTNSLVNAQIAAGVEPFGLVGYPGLREVFRDGDPTAAMNPQPVDFYSPDTFNFNMLEVDASGKTLSVSSIGMDATTQNAGIEYANGPQARTVFSFKIDAPADSVAQVPTGMVVTRSGLVLDRRSGNFLQQVTLTNLGRAALSGSIGLALDGLSVNAHLVKASGVTAATLPAGSPFMLADLGSGNVLNPGAKASVTLEFTNPTRAAIVYTTRVLSRLIP